MKPIQFNTEMVRAILDGRKTVTRRVMKPANPFRAARMGGYSQGNGLWVDGYSEDDKCNDHIKDYSVSDCWIRKDLYIKKYAPCHKADILYVRETWMPETEQGIPTGAYIYKATDNPEPDGDLPLKWKPSIHMPKEAARIFLRVTDVQVERLRDIECISTEGVTVIPADDRRDPRYYFAKLWESTIKQADIPIYGWYANPWVWVIKFERCEKPETQP